MADRCPWCNTEFGPDDRYCHECGSPRSRELQVQPVGTVADVAPTGPSMGEGDDFVPLPMPPAPAGRLLRLRRAGAGRIVAGILVAAALLAAIAAAAWWLPEDGDGGEGAHGPGRSDPPVLVAAASPRASTPDVAVNASQASPVDVVVNNIINSQVASPIATPSPVAARAGAAVSPQAMARHPATPPAAAPSIATPLAPTATVSPGRQPVATAALPPPTLDAPPPRTRATVYPARLAQAVTAAVVGIGAPSEDPPVGDGTGGPMSPMPPGR